MLIYWEMGGGSRSNLWWLYLFEKLKEGGFYELVLVSVDDVCFVCYEIVVCYVGWLGVGVCVGMYCELG